MQTVNSLSLVFSQLFFMAGTLLVLLSTLIHAYRVIRLHERISGTEIAITAISFMIMGIGGKIIYLL